MEETPQSPQSQIDLRKAFLMDEALSEILQGEPRSAEWHEMRLALQDRLQALQQQRAEMSLEDIGRSELDARISELREQVAALATEELITEFVENSLRATLARPKLPYDPDEDEGY